ncbi:Retrovirus-related Pol polyprotein from type-1 retrotransposable element R1 [Eumeta japonica]|uniref:Retrovirus-related Pol polyprotein from type-1 retrotransposable element R1 n=1 Tax=Eumeta variegata TaxID=151549 RepID=A0A4C1Z0P9_EUMVA|nr:Retrovirus-related Pol polyprotein from type-1 retrotransposable element R1 [Eumeta japonica]
MIFKFLEIFCYKNVEIVDVSHLAQTLTGHGGFSQYLHRFKLKDSPYCACDPAKIQDVLHVLEECPMFLRERVHWKRRLASLSEGGSFQQ